MSDADDVVSLWNTGDRDGARSALVRLAGSEGWVERLVAADPPREMMSDLVEVRPGRDGHAFIVAIRQPSS